MKILFSLLVIINFSSSLGAAEKTAMKRLVIIGDSITEGFGVSRNQAYPALLQKRLKKAGKAWEVINSGISGSTSASAPSRVRWHLKQKPDLIILALGANDGLRGSDVKAMQENLNNAVQIAKKAGVKIILAGIRVPPNYGATYSSSFEAVFARVAKENGVPLIPYLLDKVGGDKSKNLADGIHPNEEGYAIIAETVYQAIKEYL